MCLPWVHDVGPQGDTPHRCADRSPALAIAVAASGLLLSAAPARVSADDRTGVTQTAATVVRLDPANGRLRVSITIRVTNHTPDGVEQYSCTEVHGRLLLDPLPRHVRARGRYYVDHTVAVVDNAAEGLKVVSGGRELAVTPGDAGDSYRPVTIQFPRLFNGKRRTMVLSYTVRGGSRDRTPRCAPCGPSPGSAWRRTGRRAGP